MMRLRNWCSAGLLVLGLAGAHPAHAQASDAKPSKPTLQISPEARRHFEAGVALLDDPEGERVEEAYREFRAAHEMSGSSQILGNMGYCAMRLERDGEAIDTYSRYIREVPNIDAEERAQIVRDLQTLTVGVVRITIHVNKPGVQLVDSRVPVRGSAITNTYGPVQTSITLGLRPGHHTIIAKLAGHDDQTWEFEAFAGSREERTIALKETPPPVVADHAGSSESSRLVPPMIVTGVGAAMLATGAVTGILALGKANDIEKQCPANVCSTNFDLDTQRDKARDLVRITDIMLIGGGVVVASGITWLMLAKSQSEKPGVSSAGALCTPTGCFGSLKGAF